MGENINGDDGHHRWSTRDSESKKSKFHFALLWREIQMWVKSVKVTSWKCRYTHRSVSKLHTCTQTIPHLNNSHIYTVLQQDLGDANFAKRCWDGATNQFVGAWGIVAADTHKIPNAKFKRDLLCFANCNLEPRLCSAIARPAPPAVAEAVERHRWHVVNLVMRKKCWKRKRTHMFYDHQRYLTTIQVL